MKRLNYNIEFDYEFLKDIEYDSSVRKYKSPKELLDKINEYFRSITVIEPKYIMVNIGDVEVEYERQELINANGENVLNIIWLEPPKIEAMRRYLGLSPSQYETYLCDPDFREIILDAKSVIESYVEDKVYDRNSSGAIFILKSKFGWRDRDNQTIDVNIKKSLEDFFEEE